MEKPVVSLEISTKAVKVVVGKVEDSRLDVFYAHSEPLPKGAVELGYIINVDQVVEALSKIKTIYLTHSKSRITLEDVVLVLPSIGVEVYMNKKHTNVISESGRIENLDIANAYSLIRKDKIKPNSEIIDIIPDFFTLDDDRRIFLPPLGLSSHSLSISAKVHTIPAKILDGYRRVLSVLGLKPIRYVASAYAAASLLRTNDYFPKQYYLIDSGCDITTISLISDGSLFCTYHLEIGSSDLTKAISSKFNLSFEDSDKVKQMYGIDKEAETVVIPVFQAPNLEDNKLRKYFNRDLNETIESFLDEYLAQIERTIRNIQKEQGINPDIMIPSVMIGGLIKTHGVADHLKKKYDSDFYPGISNILGARDISFVAPLGAIVSISKSINDIIDDTPRVTSLSRVPSSPESKED